MNSIPTTVPAVGQAPSARQWLILAICFAVAMVDGFDTLMIAFIAPLIGREFKLSPAAIGQLFAAGYFGAVVGALIIGPLCDRFGRKRMLLTSLAIVVVFTFWCRLAASVQQLMALRLLSGLGLGGAMPTVMSLSAEHMPSSYRSRAVTWMFMGYPLGAVVGGAVTAAAMSSGWQIIFVGGAGAALIMIPLVVWGLSESLDAGAGATADGPQTDPRRTVFGSLVEQFREGRAPAALLLWLGVFSILVVSYFLVSWMPSVLVRSGYEPQRAAIAGVVLNIGSISGAWLVTLAVKRFGPWRPVIAAFALGAVLVWLLGERVGIPAGLWLMIFLTGMCVFGGQLSAPALSVALFPVHVRGAGTGWAMGIGRVGSIVGPLAGGMLMSAQPDLPLMFHFVAGLVVVATLAVAGAAYLRPAARDDVLRRPVDRQISPVS